MALSESSKRDQEKRDALEVASYLMSSGGGGSGKGTTESGMSAGTEIATEKQLRNLKKVVTQQI